MLHAIMFFLLKCHLNIGIFHLALFDCLSLFQEPGAWTPSKPFDQGGCDEDSLSCILMQIAIWLWKKTKTTEKEER